MLLTKKSLYTQERVKKSMAMIEWFLTYPPVSELTRGVRVQRFGEHGERIQWKVIRNIFGQTIRIIGGEGIVVDLKMIQSVVDEECTYDSVGVWQCFHRERELKFRSIENKIYDSRIETMHGFLELWLCLWAFGR
jgi:hypothetical protein